jgi:hypothetical protein
LNDLVLPDGAVVPISSCDEKGPTTMKTRLAIAALVTVELACAPFAAEAETYPISTTQKPHYNSMTASKMSPTSVFNPPGFSYPTSVLNPPGFSYPTSVLNR